MESRFIVKKRKGQPVKTNPTFVTINEPEGEKKPLTHKLDKERNNRNNIPRSTFANFFFVFSQTKNCTTKRGKEYNEKGKKAAVGRGLNKDHASKRKTGANKVKSSS